ncbi:hypothetical protein OAL15_01975 [Flavobacteriales bacterium]|nr:hypothetical protein [Flavobacteriales bacterium]
MRKTVVLGSTLIAAVLALSGLFDNEAMYGVIHADAQGYYGYLIAIFIEQSFDWEKVISSYADVYFNGGGSDFTVHTEFGRINKYYAGTSLLMLPFFLVSCLGAWLFGFPIDGYSQPFQLGMMFSALFYSGIGMYFLSRFFEAKGIKKGTSLAVVVLVLFGTNLFHYSISEPAMSHAYSFALVSLFLFKVNAWLRSSGWRDLLWSSVVFGFIVLVRPVNGLVIFCVPFIAGGLRPLLENIRETDALTKKIGIGVVVVFGVLIFQSIIYLAQVGKPLVWSYQDEGFNLMNPKVLNVLFSFKKGFFVYTPVAILGALGLALYTIKRPKAGVSLWLFLALIIYVISSWWNWYYGSSFGHRAMIEYLPFFAFGIAYLLQESIKPLRIGIIVVGLILIGVNLVQSYQYQKFILHWVGMDKSRYLEIFLKTDRKYDGIFYRRDMTISTKLFETDLETGTIWGRQGIDSTRAFSGTKSTVVGAGNSFGATIGIPVAELGEAGNRELRFSARVWCEKPQQELSLAYSYRNDTADYGHTYIQLGQLATKANEWMEITKIEGLGKPKSPDDKWIIYPYSDGKTAVYLDDLKYEIITLRE